MRLIDTVALPPRRRRAAVRRLAQQTFGLHLHVGDPRRRPGDRLWSAPARRCCPSCSRCRPARRSPRTSHRPALDAHADLHAHVPPLRRARTTSPAGTTTSDTSASSTTRGSIEEHTQIWWSVRPHLAFPTVEIRICDGQPRSPRRRRSRPSCTRSRRGCCARSTRASRCPSHPRRLLEENLWRAIRFGLSGELIDLDDRRRAPGAGAARAARRVGRARRGGARRRALARRARRRTRPSGRSRATRRRGSIREVFAGRGARAGRRVGRLSRRRRSRGAQLRRRSRKMPIADLLLQTVYTVSPLAYLRLRPSRRDLAQARLGDRGAARPRAGARRSPGRGRGDFDQ